MSGPVVVAIITSVVGPVVVGLFARRGFIRELGNRVGDPNGQGTVVQMLERLLDGQTGQDKRLARIESRLLDHEARIRSLESRHPIIDRNKEQS